MDSEKNSGGTSLEHYRSEISAGRNVFHAGTFTGTKQSTAITQFARLPVTLKQEENFHGIPKRNLHLSR